MAAAQRGNGFRRHAPCESVAVHCVTKTLQVDSASMDSAPFSRGYSRARSHTQASPAKRNLLLDALRADRLQVRWAMRKTNDLLGAHASAGTLKQYRLLISFSHDSEYINILLAMHIYYRSTWPAASREMRHTVRPHVVKVHSNILWIMNNENSQRLPNTFGLFTESSNTQYNLKSTE